jgi:hypothetical protein
MDESALLSVRPWVKYDDSGGGYTEEINDCGPRHSSVLYVVLNKHVKRILIDRGATLRDPIVTEEFIETNLGECLGLWGQPIEVGISRLSYGSDPSYVRVAVVWRQGEAQMILVYTPIEVIKVAERESNYGADLGVEVIISSGAEASADLRILGLSHEDQLLARYGQDVLKMTASKDVK